MKYKTIDLCAGIGGIRKGFELTKRFENVLSAEIDPAAAKTYKHLYKEEPMRDLTSKEFKDRVVSTKYDVLLAGFPCQSFSRIGKQLGFRDATRGTIFFELADIISRTTPRAVFLENVEYLVSHDKGNTIETIIKTLEEELEYKVIGVNVDEDGNYKYSRSSLVRNTKDFGLPQNRPRVYIMAFSKKKYGNAIKLLTQQLPIESEKTIFKDVYEILDKNVDDKYYMSQGYLNTLEKHRARNHKKGNGFGYCVVNRDRGEHPIANTILATGGSGKERNLVYQPKEGVAGKTLPGKRTKLNSQGIRVMTPNEWGRLQGFVGYAFLDESGEDGFSFPVGTTDGQKYKQFGNSVTIPVIEEMAAFMLKCFGILEEQQEEVVKAIAKNFDSFTKKEVTELLNVNTNQAEKLIKKMVKHGIIMRISLGRNARYKKDNLEASLPPKNNEAATLKLASDLKFITNIDVQESLKISKVNANSLLSNLTRKGLLQRISRGKYRTVT